MENCCYHLERESERYGMGLVRSRSFGSKRVAFVANDSMEIDFYNSSPAKKLCVMQDPSFFSGEEKSLLESLPYDILDRVLCCVEHDDLKNLIFVSRTISEATLVAKKVHFAYNTPRKAVGFRDDIIADDLSELFEFGALAPRASKIPKTRLNKKKLADISVALFD